MNTFERHIISSEKTLKNCLEKLNAIVGDSSLTLFVINEVQQVIGTITDGDIRRAFLNGKTIDDPVTEVMYKNFSFLHAQHYRVEEVRSLREKQIQLVPLLDDQKRLAGMIDFSRMQSLIPVDAVIMAGGKGLRLRPLTDELPKPLLKIGNKPILEHTIDRLQAFGVQDIHISVNYLAERIEEHFGDGSSKGLNIHYLHEQEPLGTIGALSGLGGSTHDHLLVINSDLLTTIDYENFFLGFISSGADMAVATTPYEVKVPYAILETEEDRVTSFAEKPTYTHHSSAGIYLLKKEVLDLIPSNRFYNATDLMETLIKSGRKVTYYPILGYWLDIGRHEDFKKAQEDIKHLRL